MKRLKVIAPAEAIKELRKLAKELHVATFNDGKYIKFKWWNSQPVIDRAQELLPLGSYQVYRSMTARDNSRRGESGADAIRIRAK